MKAELDGLEAAPIVRLAEASFSGISNRFDSRDPRKRKHETSNVRKKVACPAPPEKSGDKRRNLMELCCFLADSFSVRCWRSQTATVVPQKKPRAENVKTTERGTPLSPLP